MNIAPTLIIGFAALMAIGLYMMEMQDMRRDIIGAFAAIIGAIGLIVVASCAPSRAHDHNRPELNDWFKQLHSGKGMCCDGSEALHLSDVEWDTKDGHYRVAVPINREAYERARLGEKVETTWVDVDDDAVIDEPNRDGTALVWPAYYYDDSIHIRCFMPGAGT